MSTLLMDEGTFRTKYEPYHSRSRVLKSRENISKLKCNKSLKKKLKKYKLRKDGQEDPDIIDVSHSLIHSLRIKSPNQHFCHHKESEENRPHNYLAKMVRLKKTVKAAEATSANVSKCQIENKIEPICKETGSQDEGKRQMDAFKLLMDSRNKSIGSNSPGKEKYEESDLQQKAEMKELRAKRILSLNKMAQAKGSLRKLEIEEYREESIKRKMEHRAKRLKHMIIDVGGKKGNKPNIKPVKKVVETSDSPITVNVIENRETLDMKKSVLKTFDLLEDMKVSLNSNVQKISKEDEEFLNKLSPSIRKKENMLSYFQKVSKEPDNLQEDDNNTGSHSKDQLVIKVKLKSGKKVTKKKSKHIIEKVKKNPDNTEDDGGMMNQNVQDHIPNSNDNIKKRKRNENKELSQDDILNNSINGTIQNHNDSRPKRNTKKPVKYADDVQVTSSDEELHIFTPKKKRKDKLVSESNKKSIAEQHIEVEDCRISDKVAKTKQSIIRVTSKNPLKNEHHRNVLTKKATKLAPIFVTKPLIDSASFQAKQKFLQSGVPSQLKKSSTHQSNILASNEFQRVVHIQHINDTMSTSLNSPIIRDISSIINTNYSEDINLKEETNIFKKLLEVPVLDNYSIPKLHKNVDQVLSDIKKEYPKFPVYRTYHLLRGKSKGEFKDCIYPDLDNSVEIVNNMVDINNINPDKLNWADKYKPTTEKQVIGNFESIRELRQWLVTWTENDAKTRMNKCGSDSSDFYQSDTDSRETLRNENNLLIITGKVGTGKTLSVYAVAAELAIKVIEVNASTKRTGKIMLQDLQEATQSHKVDRCKNSTDSSQKLQEVFTTNSLAKVAKKRGRKKKVTGDSKVVITKKDPMELTVSQDNVRTGMSLILIDDADIVFDQDDGFCYAISQLIQSSKRPVILVTASLTCPHLQKFVSLAKIIKMRPFLPRMLGTWLDIMCLVDNNMCSQGLGAKLLDLFKGDIRRTINYLQFYMTSHKHMSIKDDSSSCLSEEKEPLKVNADDENSCMSWGDNEGWGDKNSGSCNSNDICNIFVNKESHFLGLLNNFNMWWNLPNVLNYTSNHCKYQCEKFDKIDKTKGKMDLNKIADVLDTISVTDYLGTLNDEPNITTRPWQSFERDSVTDNENFAIYNRNDESINEISWDLVTKSIAEAQRNINPGIKIEMNYPNTSMKRERDRVISRHTTITKCLSPSTALDRRGLALDYWSACRSICRTETSKTSTNNKRNNRFCHYLKSLNIVCRNEYFDNLGESLCFK